VSRARRSLLLLGLAVLLGTLAAADVSRREAAVERRLGPAVDRMVAARELPAGRRLRLGDLALRRVPELYAPPGAAASAHELVGGHLWGPVAAGAYLGAADLRSHSAGAPVGPGERATEIVAVGSPAWVVPGARVDVLVTGEGPPGPRAAAELALEDVEVLDSRAAGSTEAGEPGVRRVAATLRVSVRQAVYLASAQAAASEIRLLPRAAGDRAKGPG
jgi:pilus assembly protein CpaB